MAIDRRRLCPARVIRATRRTSARAALLMLAALAFVLAAALGPLTPAAASGGWGWPLEPPEVIHGFDPPDNPYGSGHRGVDLAGFVGQVVMAPSSGVVTFAGVIAGRGVVVVSHGAVRSTYEPVAAGVVIGASVGAGDHLGTLQGFAHHCGLPCLHWGVIEGETYLDPLDFVGVGPSRLLPWWDDSARGGAVLPGGPVAPPGAAPQGFSSTDPAAAQRRIAREDRSAVDRPPAGGAAPPAPAGADRTVTPVSDATAGYTAVPPAGTAAGPAASGQAAGARAEPGPERDTGAGMVTAAVLAVAGGALAGGVVLRVLRSRR